ncbi:glyoxalase/bleomycin resistance protein/dioxygenase [Shewanella sediminis HAW-EB3]|uniref:Glyoxalase/bleomycin resistance protein/dioxygenase n=1 Tax=Shewanella sediminis (strain HAW-EB3) TaxID=425104 RepID=A8FRY0_SHESH|nr:VOC family protein [Shewanella sediminis]ABV35603.1 glyoxalase/bleomycin resistance protein/dioxygenase [Shewanella sediminis HAW-EB3]
MIHLEHVNLVVEDIPKTLHFYRAAFPHWKVRGGGEGSWHGKPRDWVHFGDDYQYLTFNNDGVGENRDLTGHQIGLAHFAFVTDDLDAIIERLDKAGYPVDKEGAEDDFRRNVYYIDPNGYEVEFVQYLSDIPSERNRYD